MTLADDLRVLLADLIAFHLRAYGHHWNVEGPNFREYHGLFGDIVDDVYGSIDPLAENIRKLGEHVPFRIERHVDAKCLPDKQKVSSDCKALAEDLLDCNEHLVTQLKAAFHAADEADEQGIADFLAGRIDAHQKHSWFLKASLKK